MPAIDKTGVKKNKQKVHKDVFNDIFFKSTTPLMWRTVLSTVIQFHKWHLLKSAQKTNGQAESVPPVLK